MLKKTNLNSTADLLLINLTSALLIVAILLVPDSQLRTILGVPFVLFFPGYTLIAVLFPAKTDLGGIERLSLSLGLSLAIVPLIGLALNYTPWGIRLTPIVTSLFVLTILLSMTALYRRNKLPIEQKISFTNPVRLPKGVAIRKFDKLFLIGIVVAIVLVASVTSYIAFAPKTNDQFTEFYILGADGKLADYPTNLTLGQSGNVTMCLINHEAHNETYKITITFDNKTFTTINSITLPDGANWSRTYTFTPDKAGNHLKLEFQLYKQDIPDVYRSLQLWIDV
jgi:uncharacterized membrane protein